MHQVVRDEARSAGLGHGDISLSGIDRRRTELWALAVSVVTATAALASLAPERLPWFAETAPTWTLRATLAMLSVAFVAYVFEKEVHLRQLQALLVDERILSRAFAERADQLASLAEGARAVNAVLDLDEVLTRLLDRALDMVRAHTGAVLVVEGSTSGDRPTVLRAACVRGGRRAVGERIGSGEGPLGLGLRDRRPVLDTGDDERPSTIAVPLVHRDELLGALEVHADDGREFGEYEFQVLSVFADYVSVGLANARLYDVERSRVAELTELDEMKSQFLSTVSHELKTPLTSIIGSASVLRRAPTSDAERDEFLGSIDRQARRLAQMVDQLLVAGRLEEEPFHPDEVADLCEVAHLVVADLALAGRHVELDAPGSYPVRCGTGPLQQVLVNLIDNAHKHGSEPVRLEVASRGAVTVGSVLDSGPGVPVEARERVFDRFHRLDATGSRPGMGLGLPIVRQIVEACGGRVWIDSRPGGGTAVRVALATAPDGEAPGTRVAPVASGAGVATAPASPRGVRT